MDLTKETCSARCFAFSMPFLFTNLLQACYGASDLFMVGHFSDAAAVCAVAVGAR